MNITKEQIDELNAVVKVTLAKEDYQPKVDHVLNDYRKKANVPGFRKGHVPVGLIKKQFGKAVLVEEVNKLLQENLNKFITEQNLDILGYPLPKPNDNLDWDKENLSFEFELGLAPSFEVSLTTKKATPHYHIVADKKMIQDQVTNYQKRYGKLININEVEELAEIKGTFINEKEGIHKNSILELDKVANKKVSKSLIGKKVGEKVTLKTKGLFEEVWKLTSLLGLTYEKAKDLDIEIEFTIEEINKRELAALNQELFDKLYGKDNITSEEELRKEIKEVSEKSFKNQADQQLINDITEKLIAETKFDLPVAFLKKWMQNSGEQILTEEEAAQQFEQSEKSIRYQLIETKLIANHNLQVEFEELQDYAKNFIRNQMMQYGQLSPDEEMINNLAMRTLSNKDEMSQLSSQLMSQKLLQLFKEKCNLKKKEVNFQEFIKEASAK